MFLGLAGQLVQAGQAGPQGAGSHLYTLLFAAHPTPQLCQVCIATNAVKQPRSLATCTSLTASPLRFVACQF